jgi:hypothetical protein
MAKTINDFIKELQTISKDKRNLPLVIAAPNGTLVYPKVKMIFKEDNFLTKPEVEKMIITLPT